MITPGTTPIPFVLNQESREDILNREINWDNNPIGFITVYRTYLRKKENGQLENWNECVLRVIEGMFTILKTHVHNSGLIWDEEKAQNSAMNAANRLFEFKWTPPGRGLWMMGTNFIWEKGSAALNSCSFVSTEHIDQEYSEPFRFLMDMSMLGVGVGFDTRGAEKVEVKRPQGEKEIFVVPDSREGWVELIGRLIDSYLDPNVDTPVEPDTSLVRPYGEPIKGFGGVASGPVPLVQGYNGIKDILENRVGEKLTSVDITDIQNIIGKIVVAGNVRRTAEIAFSNSNDYDFRTMKSFEKYPVESGLKAPDELAEVNYEDYETFNNAPFSDEAKAIVKKYQDYKWSYKFGGWRWASNNSIFAEVGMDYEEIAESIAENGEPGIMWPENVKNYSRMIDSPDYKDVRAKGSNPCMEQTLESYELCCLVETFPSNHKNYKDFSDTLKVAYLYAKAVTLMGTHNPKTNTIMSRNRRIGCSQSGIAEALTKFGRYYYQKNMLERAYNRIQELDVKYSEWLGIPRSVKTTSVKPSGSVSLVANVSPGVHMPKVRYGYRTVRISKDSPLVQVLQNANYHVENSITDPQMTVVAYFPIINKESTPTEEDSSIWEQFINAATLQKKWADNQVSCTISFRSSEKNQIAKCLSTFDTELKGISLLPMLEHGFPQAPYISANKEEVEQYKKQLLPLDLSFLHNTMTEGENSEANKFCDGDSCQI